MAPAPSEASILHQFLLAPAQLPGIISLADFTALFPKAHQNSPQIRTLYRDLQRQRNAAVDDVAAAIDAEAARGRALYRSIIRARLRADAQEDIYGDDELQIEHILTGHQAGDKGQPRDPASMILELEAAVQSLEDDLKDLESEDLQLRDSLRQTIGSLSDLRYGRLANTQLRDEVLESLNFVNEVCSVVKANGTAGRSP